MKVTFVVPVDFGNADEDGAVRLITRGTLEYCRHHDVMLVDGMKITMSDGEVTAEGVVSRRGEFWVAIVEKWVT